MNTKREIIWFLLAGPFVVATDFIVYYFLIHFFSFIVSKGVSFICASIVGYLINKYWTFKYNHPSVAEVSRYFLVNFLALGVNVLTNHIVLNLRPGAVFIALVIATVITSIFSFVSFKFWVFRNKLKNEVICG
ncbi:MAG: GtrA family protein [Candidatus Omnitrophica bacterium]|nr:GtrA family protein [Candidatus Omnitrophota bacterium]